MKKKNKNCSRREFIKRNTIAGLGTVFSLGAASALLTGCSREEDGETQQSEESTTADTDPIIDIHQHTNYHGRSYEELLAHQRAMGITTTILLPAGRPVQTASTHGGDSNGLGGVQAGGNESCFGFAQKFPDEFLFAANEVPDIAEAIDEIEKYLKLGGQMIGELKFGVDCDSPEMQKIYKLAGEYDVPVLMHWQYGRYNFGFDRFHKMLEKYPDVNFIGHAQTWWANIDKKHEDQSIMFPSGKVTRGGLTDRLLSDYPNMYGDLSAGSGLNSMTRDEDHARGFLERHQEKLLYGSDCADPYGHGPDCQGAQTIKAIRRLTASKRVERKLLYENSKKLFGL